MKTDAVVDGAPGRGVTCYLCMISLPSFMVAGLKSIRGKGENVNEMDLEMDVREIAILSLPVYQQLKFVNLGQFEEVARKSVISVGTQRDICPWENQDGGGSGDVATWRSKTQALKSTDAVRTRPEPSLITTVNCQDCCIHTQHKP